MTQPTNHFVTSASGGLPAFFALGMVAALIATPTVAAQQDDKTVLSLVGTPYTVTSYAPMLGAVSFSGNVSGIMYTEPAETAIQRVYASLYLSQRELDSDMEKILHANLSNLYEE
jgi:hypothetical protein